MSEFEFSTVLVSIVVAIAVTEILATWGRMIRLRSRVRPYWVHVGWMGLVLLLAVQFWFSLWELREWPDWNFFVYVLHLVPFFTLVLIAYLLCPDLTAEEYGSLEEYFFGNSTWLFLLGAAFLVQLMIVNPLLRGEPWIGPENGIRSLALGAILPLARTKNRIVHAGVLTLCYALFFLFVLFLILSS